MGQATLSESLEKSLEITTLQDLKNREYIYVVPWEMRADEQGFLWLANCDYTLYRQPFGTYGMKVTKKNGLYICDVSLCNGYVWHKGIGWTDGLPVAEVIGRV